LSKIPAVDRLSGLLDRDNSRLAAVLELVALHFARFPRLSRVCCFCQAFSEDFSFFPLASRAVCALGFYLPILQRQNS
jgi:hypothetical protein